MENITLITNETKIQPDTNDYINNTDITIIEECIICYNEYKEEDSIIFSCKHKVCVSCYQTMINTIPNLCCPICRKSLESDDQYYNDGSEYNEYNREVYQYDVITVRLRNNSCCSTKNCSDKLCKLMFCIFFVLLIYSSVFVKL